MFRLMGLIEKSKYPEWDGDIAVSDERIYPQDLEYELYKFIRKSFDKVDPHFRNGMGLHRISNIAGYLYNLSGEGFIKIPVIEEEPFIENLLIEISLNIQNKIIRGVGWENLRHQYTIEGLTFDRVLPNKGYYLFIFEDEKDEDIVSVRMSRFFGVTPKVCWNK